MLRKIAQALSRRGAHGDIVRALNVFEECLSLLEQMGDARTAKQVRAELSDVQLTERA